MGLWESFLSYVIRMGSKFFYSMRPFCFLILFPFNLRKLGKEQKKNLIRMGFFLRCFIKGNETWYSSMFFVWKIEIFVSLCLIIIDWFYAFRNTMSTFLFFWIFIYFKFGKFLVSAAGTFFCILWIQNLLKNQRVWETELLGQNLMMNFIEDNYKFNKI